MTATEIYDDQVKRLPVSERLRLVSLILNDIPKEDVVDVSDEWTEQDLEDFVKTGWSEVPGEARDRDDD